jgi:hypothetical protein
MRLTGALYDANNSAGSSGQVLSTTGAGADWIDNPSPTGTGAANKVAFWTGTGTLGYNSNLHWDNTNDRLGIGIPTPSYKLHVVESSATRGIFVTNSANVD